MQHPVETLPIVDKEILSMEWRSRLPTRYFDRGDCGKVISIDSNFKGMITAGAYHVTSVNNYANEYVRLNCASACCFIDTDIANYLTIADAIRTEVEDRNQTIGALFRKSFIVPRGKYPMSLFPAGYDRSPLSNIAE